MIRAHFRLLDAIYTLNSFLIGHVFIMMLFFYSPLLSPPQHNNIYIIFYSPRCSSDHKTRAIKPAPFIYLSDILISFVAISFFSQHQRPGRYLYHQYWKSVAD